LKGSCGGDSIVAFGQEVGEILAGEFPLERLGGRFPVGLKLEQTLGQGIESGEIIRRQNLALDD
jgi:hypothetical protein